MDDQCRQNYCLLFAAARLGSQLSELRMRFSRTCRARLLTRVVGADVTASGGHLSRDLSELIETYLSHTKKERGMKRKVRSRAGTTVASVRITAFTAPDDSSLSQHKVVIQSAYALSASSKNTRGELCHASVSEPRLKALLSSNAAALRELTKQTTALARLSRRTNHLLASEGYSHLLEQQVKVVNLTFARYIKSREELFLYIKTSTSRRASGGRNFMASPREQCGTIRFETSQF
jgi:hypothetical protein